MIKKPLLVLAVGFIHKDREGNGGTLGFAQTHKGPLGPLTLFSWSFGFTWVMERQVIR